MEAEACPGCGQTGAVAGDCWGLEIATRFLPDGGWAPAQFSAGINLMQRFQACRHCGLVWSRVVAPERLNRDQPSRSGGER